MQNYELMLVTTSGETEMFYSKTNGEFFKSESHLSNVLNEMKNASPELFERIDADDDIVDYYVIRHFTTEEVKNYLLERTDERSIAMHDNDYYEIKYNIAADKLDEDGISAWCDAKVFFNDYRTPDGGIRISAGDLMRTFDKIYSYLTELLNEAIYSTYLEFMKGEKKKI